ncbi:MAG: tetraacyldisaccharide 4'-kinase [Bacteroidota bacterium]|jgi:tetraacyldisaccharide 4'-kinase
MPFSIGYGLITFIRNFLYDWGILRSHSFKEHNICIGNLSVGGTGKTPHIEYIIRLLKKDYAVATLSRGYKRKTSGFVMANHQSTVDDIGDEPKQFKIKFPDIRVAVDGNRVNGIKKLLNQAEKPDVILLDDAFQHRRLKPGFSVLLTDYAKIFRRDSMLPGGSLREYQSNYKRADVIVITKTPERISNLDLKVFSKEIKLLPHQKLFFSWIKYGEPYYFSDVNFTLEVHKELFKFNVFIFTGIANPKPLLNYIKEYANQVTHRPFADHHEFTESDILEIRKDFNNLSGQKKLIITTEKDFMRLKKGKILDEFTGLPLFIIPIEIDFKNKTEEFNQIITNYVRTNRIYHSKYFKDN